MSSMGRDRAWPEVVEGHGRWAAGLEECRGQTRRLA